MEKTSWKENRRLATLVLVIAVLLSLFGIGGMKVRGVGDKARATYAETIGGCLSARIAAAENILAAAEGAGVDTARAQNAVKALRDADNPTEDYEANTVLTAEIGLVYEAARQVMDAQAGSLLQTQWSEFLSNGQIIQFSQEDYNSEARTAQKKLSGFPASLLATLTGARVYAFATA